MGITLIYSIKKVFINSTSKNSYSNSDGFSTHAAEIRDLNAEDFSVVSGGPQIQNEPQK
jgi:hypothetical protein